MNGAKNMAPISKSYPKATILNNNKAIKKTLTIPCWLNNLSERNNINFSQVLQEALKERLGITE